MEQREPNVEVKAMSLISEFAKKFRSIDFTLHPSDIPGESAGKGSNVAWAARKLSEKYAMAIRKDVIVTGIDGEFLSSLGSAIRARRAFTSPCILIRGSIPTMRSDYVASVPAFAEMRSLGYLVAAVSNQRPFLCIWMLPSLKWGGCAPY